MGNPFSSQKTCKVKYTINGKELAHTFKIEKDEECDDYVIDNINCEDCEYDCEYDCTEEDCSDFIPDCPPTLEDRIASGLRYYVFDTSKVSNTNMLVNSGITSSINAANDEMTSLYSTPDDNFMLQLYGLLKASQSGTYHFRYRVDDVLIVTINGVEVINTTYTEMEVRESETTIDLVDGQYYPIFIYMSEGTGGHELFVEYKVDDGEYTTFGEGDFYHVAPVESFMNFPKISAKQFFSDPINIFAILTMLVIVVYVIWMLRSARETN